MKKLILLLLLLNNLLYSYNYDELLLKAQASIFPKIMLLDKKIEEKLINGKVIYTIVYDKEDYYTAQKIGKLIDISHKGQFDQYTYKINLVESSKISTKTQASAIYALNSSKNIKKIADVAKEKGIVAFSYDISNLKNGFLFSLMLEKSTILYLNKENLYTKNIDFVDILFQIVKFIDKNDG